MKFSPYIPLVIIFIIVFPYSYQAQDTILITRGAYLQQVTPTSIIIRWRTNIPVNSKVEYGSGLDYDSEVILNKITTEHVINLTNLNPAAKYFYSVGTSSTKLQGDSLNYFYTAPDSGDAPFTRIWVTGDFGVGTSNQSAVRDAFVKLDAVPTNLWLWLGDNAYNSGTDQQYQDYVFNMYPDELKHFPLYPSPGNHDYSERGYNSRASLTTNFPYFDIFTVPQKGEAGGIASRTPKYYSFNYGNIHCISLDSYGASNKPGSPMYNWLVEDLASNNKLWTIIYFHHPPFSKGSHDSDSERELIDIRTHLVPLFETFKVDLVLSGHSHSNERSYFMRGHNGPSYTFDTTMKMSGHISEFVKEFPFEGTVYAVCGTSGQLPGKQMDAPMPCMHFNDFTSNCSMVIDVDKNQLRARFLTSKGIIADEFSIMKDQPSVPATDSTASCEISYHPASGIIYLSMFLHKKSDFSATLHSAMGEKILEMKTLPKPMHEGYQVLPIWIRKKVRYEGTYVVKVTIGNQHFSKRIFVRPEIK